MEFLVLLMSRCPLHPPEINPKVKAISMDIDVFLSDALFMLAAPIFLKLKSTINLVKCACWVFDG